MVSITELPVGDLGVLSDLINHADIMLKGKYGFIPDFDSLPSDIKSKFKKGIYTLGESKQVDGNVRAVILDEDGVRVKDITLKKVMNDDHSIETTRDIVNQLQMRQLYAKLNEIQEIQTYQIESARNQEIVTPFLTARDYILEAQTAISIEDRKAKLDNASHQLKLATNAIYTDLNTTSKYLAKATNRFVFQNTKQRDNYMSYLIDDLQIVTKSVGVQMQIYNYLGEQQNANNVLEQYQHNMKEFATKAINNKEQSVLEVIHNFFPYSEENKNCWINVADEMKTFSNPEANCLEDKEVYLVSVEEVEDE